MGWADEFNQQRDNEREAELDRDQPDAVCVQCGAVILMRVPFGKRVLCRQCAPDWNQP